MYKRTFSFCNIPFYPTAYHTPVCLVFLFQCPDRTMIFQMLVDNFRFLLRCPYPFCLPFLHFFHLLLNFTQKTKVNNMVVFHVSTFILQLHYTGGISFSGLALSSTGGTPVPFLWPATSTSVINGSRQSDNPFCSFSLSHFHGSAIILFDGLCVLPYAVNVISPTPKFAVPLRKLPLPPLSID